MSDNEFIAQYDDLPSDSTPAPSVKVDEVAEIKEVVESKDEIVINNDVVETKEASEPVEAKDPIEESARSQGWVPQEEWSGDPSLWRDPQVFLERGDYFKTMSTQRKQIDKLNQTVDKMAEIQVKTREDERKKVLKELSDKKLDAMENSDYVKVMDIDSEILKVRAEPAITPVAVTENNTEAQETAAAYIEKNKWYTEKPEMRAQADLLSNGYLSINAGAPIEDVIAYVDSEIKIRYPQEFGNSVPSASPVAGNNRTTKPNSTKSGGKKKTLNDLPSEKRDMYAQIGQSFVDSGAVNSIDEYIAELEKIGEL